MHWSDLHKKKSIKKINKLLTSRSCIRGYENQRLLTSSKQTTHSYKHGVTLWHSASWASQCSHRNKEIIVLPPSVNINLVEQVDNLRNHLFGFGFCQFCIFPVDKWQNIGRNTPCKVDWPHYPNCAHHAPSFSFSWRACSRAPSTFEQQHSRKSDAKWLGRFRFSRICQHSSTVPCLDWESSMPATW